MHPLTRADQDLYLSEEIHYPSRCQFPGCLDDIIPDPNGGDRYCLKHYNYIGDL
jgi:hypothetical protein